MLPTLPPGAHTIRRQGFTSSSTSAACSSVPTFESLRADLAAFATERDWDQFHTPRNLALAMVGEVGELAEIFQWKPDGSCPPGLAGWKDETLVHLGEEMADVLLYLVRLADRCGIDLPAAAARKLQINGIKYPAAAVRGRSTKYNEYKNEWRGQKRTRDDEVGAQSQRSSGQQQPAAKKGKRTPEDTATADATAADEGATAAATSAVPTAKTVKKRIIMLGLDGAGKTRILYKLKLPQGVASTIPTVGFNVECVSRYNVEFDIWDVGGSEGKRPLWSQFYANTDAVIFVVDACADIEETARTKHWIEKVLAAAELRGVPILVMLNKQDLLFDLVGPHATIPRDVVDNTRAGLMISDVLAKHEVACTGCPMRAFRTSAVTGYGLDSCLDLLVQWTTHPNCCN